MTLATEVVPNIANMRAKHAMLQNDKTLKIPRRGTNKFGTILPGKAAALMIAIYPVFSIFSQLALFAYTV